MHAVTINTIIDDPLAGCLAVVKQGNNATTLLRSILIRMRLFYNEKKCKSISDQIIRESDDVTIDPWEYIINENLYEMRRISKGVNEMLETAVLSNWTRELMKIYTHDQALEFVSRLKNNRLRRKR